MGKGEGGRKEENISRDPPADFDRRNIFLVPPAGSC